MGAFRFSGEAIQKALGGWILNPGDCIVAGCRSRNSPKKIFCHHHWVIIPPAIKDRIIDSYSPGQFKDRKITTSSWGWAVSDALEFIEAYDRAV